MDTAIFFKKMHFLVKCVVLALDELDVQVYGLSHFLSAGTQKVPIRIQEQYPQSICLANKQKMAITDSMGKTLGDPGPAREGCICCQKVLHSTTKSVQP